MGGVYSSYIHTRTSLAHRDHPQVSFSMSPKDFNFHLFGQLPPELRLLIWEMAASDLPSRLCSAILPSITGNQPDSVPWKNSEGLFVFDFPFLRYVCHESRQVALKHSAAAGWTVSGQHHPYRRYAPDVDVFYLADLTFVPLLWRSLWPRIQRNSDDAVFAATMQLRQAGHIAISHWHFEQFDNDMFSEVVEMIIQGFPQAKNLSLVIKNVDKDGIIDPNSLFFRPSQGIPQRPCKLGFVTIHESITEEAPEPMVSAYMERHASNKVYCRAEEFSTKFATTAEAVARRLNCNCPPTPRPANILQLERVNDEGEEWEEVYEDQSGALRRGTVKTLRVPRRLIGAFRRDAIKARRIPRHG